MEYTERVRNAYQKLKLFDEGSIFKAHFSLLGFGTVKKPFHFSVIPNQIKPAMIQVLLHPITTKKRNDSFTTVKVNLTKESTVKGLPRESDSYILMDLPCRLPVTKVMEAEEIIHCGWLKKEALERYQKAKVEYLMRLRRDRG